MQNGQNSNFLTVLPPSPFSQLGKYQRKGVFIVRKGDEILYIGQAGNICRAAKRLFYQKGALQHIDQRTVLFEVITSNARSSIVLESLKGVLRANSIRSDGRASQRQRIKELLQQSMSR